MIITPVSRIDLTNSCIKRLIHFARSYSVESVAIILGALIQEGGKKVVQAKEIIFTENAENSSSRFSIDAEILYAIYRYAEQSKKEIIAIFHSHPTVTEEKKLQPSSTDQQFMRLNPCVWLIAGGIQSSKTDMKAYQMVRNCVIEVKVKIKD